MTEDKEIETEFCRYFAKLFSTFNPTQDQNRGGAKRNDSKSVIKNE